MAKRLQVVFVCLLCCVVVECSEKKGIGMAPAQFKCDDFKALTNMNWWYNWGANGDKLRKQYNCPDDFEQYLPSHVPMAWGNGSTFPNYIVRDDAPFFLAFNEPNHQKQSNLTPSQAAELWPEIENLAVGKKIVSPAVAPCGSMCNGNETEWLIEFFQICSGCRVDHLATHVYYCDVERVMAYLYRLYTTFNKPIWVTEFACPGEDDPAVQLEFMKTLLPQLEEASYVYRYAWYISRLVATDMFVKPAISLLEADSSTLTTLGEYYNGFGESTTTASTTTNGDTSTPTADTTTKKTSSSDSVSIGKSALVILRCYILLFPVIALWYLVQ